MIYIQHTASGIRAEREPFDGGAAYGEVGEPVAWMHTLHMERGQTFTRLLDHDGTDEYEPSRTGFGMPGRDYSEEYAVTATPLYTGASANNELIEALRKIIAHFDRDRSNGCAPGHGHRIPGVWDVDISNGAKGGTDCEWCAEWAGFRALLTRVKGDE